MAGEPARSGEIVTESAVTSLAGRLRGALIRPRDPAYDAARRVWNGTIDRRPALIARCTGVADVRECVNFAREQGLPAAIRGGGHNVAGSAVCDDGLVIDLSSMKGIWVDAAGRRARAQGGVTWGDLDRETQLFGLATPGGVISTTGIAGLTLGGGVGWLVRKHGLSCDNLLSADVVTADGQVLKASPTEHSDLFWGLRGGGGNFGVVTALEFGLHPQGPVLGGLIVHPFAAAKDLVRFHRDFIQEAPEELTMYVGCLTPPDGQLSAALVMCYSGDLGEGERVLRPARHFGKPLADLVQPMPHVAMQSMLDAGFPAGNPNYWKSTFLRDLPDEAIDVFVSHASRVTTPLSAALLEFYGGKASQVGETETAFPHRQAQYDLGIMAQWADSADPGSAHKQWVREFWTAMAPYSSGRSYSNFVGEDPDVGVRGLFGKNYERLADLKRRYDPANLFRFNHNIKATS